MTASMHSDRGRQLPDLHSPVLVSLVLHGMEYVLAL